MQCSEVLGLGGGNSKGSSSAKLKESTMHKDSMHKPELVELQQQWAEVMYMHNLPHYLVESFAVPV